MQACNSNYLNYANGAFYQKHHNAYSHRQRIYKRINIMAKLYFRHGAMGSSKTANALMTSYNYYERGKKALLAKPKLDTRDAGVVRSRMGLEQECKYVEDVVIMSDSELQCYDCIIIDEAQFCKKSDIEFLSILLMIWGFQSSVTDFAQISAGSCLRAVCGFLHGLTLSKN